MPRTKYITFFKHYAYCIIPVFLLVGFHYVMYGVPMLMVPPWSSYYTLNSVVDDVWPFSPIWIIIYYGANYFILLEYFLTGLASKRHFYTFATANILIHVVSFFAFIHFPVKAPRPDVLGGDIWSQLLLIHYASDLSFNCFPSLHCGLATLSFLGIYKVRRISKKFQVFSAVMTVLICFSTLFCKQHFFLDTIAGVSFATILFWASARFCWYKPVMRFFEWINDAVWGRILTKD